MQHDSPTTVGIFILRRKILHNQKAAYKQAAFYTKNLLNF